MKKLNGIKKGFSSLENKTLANAGSILGGKLAAQTNEKWSDPTCDNNCADTGYYTDGVRTSTTTTTTDCP